MSLPGASVGLTLLQASQLVSVSPRQLVLPESIAVGACLRETVRRLYYLLLKGRDLVNLVSFRN